MTGFTNQPLTIALPVHETEVLVTTPDGSEVKLPTFIDETGRTYFRFASNAVGSYAYRGSPTGHQTLGTIQLKQYMGVNLLMLHGRIVASPHSRYLAHTDGTPFFWLADTWWFAMTQRTLWPDVFSKIVRQRKNLGFTVGQVVIGYPPEVALDSPNAANTGGFPLLDDGTINPRYFQEVDAKIAFLVESGIVPCIFGGWGHHLDVLGADKVKTLWREIIARYAAYPVVFCLAGEVDLQPPPGYAAVQPKHTRKLSVTKLLPYQLKKILKRLLLRTHQTSATPIQKRLKSWSAIARFIKETCPFPVVLTAHVYSDTTAKVLFDSPKWLDLDTFQSGHSYQRRPAMIQNLLAAAGTKIINLEPWYEQIGGQFGAADQRYSFWMSLLAGASGVSYGAHGLWNMATSKDNFLAHWGVSDWQSAQLFPGAHQLGLAKIFLSARRWWQLEPLPKILKPGWDAAHSLRPLAAKIDQEIIIYFPAQPQKETYTVTLPQKNNSKTLITWYDPATMDKRSSKTVLQQTISLTGEPNRDVLLCCRPADASHKPKKK